MNDNNSSSFCYRTIKNTDIVSNHGKGLAIDINPIQNPHVVGDDISPKSGYNFKDRTNIKQGMIIEGDDLYNAFIKRGWTWGCLLYTSPSPRDMRRSRMPSSA